MDSLTLIVKYIFNKYNFDVDFKSIDSLFEDGVLFPSFISLIFNVNEIPDINMTPVTKEDIKLNNDKALRFLFENNNLIDKEYMKYKSKEDKKNLIAEILKKQCFELNHQRLIDDFNLIFQPYKIQFSSENEFVNLKNLIRLIIVLTGGKAVDVSDNPKDIDMLLSYYSKKARIPIFLDSKTLNDQNKYLFFIQVEVIFDIFNVRESIQKVLDEELFEGTEKKKRKTGFFKFFRRKNESQDSIISESSSEYYSDDADDKENEDIQNVALLNTINVIGSKYNISFKNFDEAVKNDAIPSFVMRFLDLKEIKNVEVKNTPKAKSGSERLTKDQIDNIKAVIEFIKNEKKIKKFKVLLFNFEDLKSVESSTISFYENFLNCFYIKMLKQEMYLKIAKLLCTHTSKFKENYDERLFTKYKIYPCLLHFLTKKNLHFTFNYHTIKFKDEEVEKYFADADVPMIINKEMLVYSKRYVSFPVFYQIQFIFNALEQTKTPSHRIAEGISGALFELRKIEVPKFSEIASSIKAKKNSVKYQKQMRNKYQTEKNDDKTFNEKEKGKIGEIEKPITYIEMLKNDEKSIYFYKKLILREETSDFKLIKTKTSYKIWDIDDPNYINENGIIFNKTTFNNNKKESQTNWMNEITNIQKDIKKRERKTLMQTKDTAIIQQSFNFNRRKSGFEPKLYKIYSYDTQNEKWIFNKDVFERFSKEKKIDIDSSKTPLILFMDSYEDEVKTINSNFINSLYPNLEKDNPNEIFVYALCDRSLTMLNFIVDFHNAEKASIKPIFLLLHIPKSKENCDRIRLIVTKIYSFLSLICDFNVVVLNKNHYLDQVDFIKSIQEINGKSTNEETPFSFKFQNHSPDTGLKFGFRNKEPKFVFLVNDQAVQFSEEVDKKLNKNEFFTNLLLHLSKEAHLHYINVDDSDTYECFLTTMNDMIMKECSTFSEIKENLSEIEYSNFSEVSLETLYNIDELRKLLKEKLEILSNSHLKFIDKKLNQKAFWKYQQMAYMVDAHKKFLKNEYASMIKSLIDENSIKSMFELNFDVVENQLKKDRNRIMEILNPFIENIKTKSLTEVHELRSTMKEGTNYAMKETENLREVKVTVQVNKDLKSEIPQDF